MRLEESGDLAILDAFAETPPAGPIEAGQAEIDRLFAATPAEIVTALEASASDLSRGALAALRRASPLAVACGLANIRALRDSGGDIADALRAEYRFTYRASEKSDFLEGIRAAIIDKDKAPRWKHATLADVSKAETAAMLAPLGENELTL